MTRIKNPVSAKTLVQLGVEVAKGTSRRNIMAQLPGAPERLIRELQRVRLGEAEYRELMINELQDAAHESLASWREDLKNGKVPAATKPIASAIFLDKASMLAGHAAFASAAVNVQVNNFLGPHSREEMMARLRGENPNPVLRPAGDGAKPIGSALPVVDDGV